VLKLKCDGPLSNFAFKVNLRRYNEVLSAPERRRGYDLGQGLGAVNAESGEETTLWDEVEQKHFPERYGFKPFGDPLERKRKFFERRANRHDEF